MSSLLNSHSLWLYFSFLCGMVLWLLNKAKERADGRDPNVAKWWQYFSEYWIPLLTRFVIDTAIFAVTFNAQLVTKGLDAVGWTNWAWVVAIITQFAPCAFGFGFIVDANADKYIGKIPLVGGLIPTIPLPQHTENKMDPGKADVKADAVIDSDRAAKGK